jgi:tRNA(Ile)-lysidine synthase
VNCPLIDRLLERARFPAPGSAVTCAVSGGADSLALLVLARAAELDVTAVHVDPGLRPGSADEALVVRDAAARFGAAFVAERVDVEPGPNLEARARAARFAVLPAGVLTGHTADDQAETVLLNLLRGAGLDGLSGMAPGGHPLLGLRRSDTHALCAEVVLEPVADPSNTDPVHLRNRVRHELLPLLVDLAGRDVVPVLARQSTLLRDEASYLDEQAAAVDATDVRALAALPAPLARRALRSWLRDGVDHPPDAAAVERVLAVVRHEARACQLNDGRRVSRSRGRLDVEPATTRFEA